MKAHVLAIHSKWPHYLVKITRIGGGQAQISAHFQPQLGSRSGWQVCEDARLHMGRWQIDEKSKAYLTAKGMCPISWRGLAARTYKVQRNMEEEMKSLEKGDNTSEVEAGGEDSGNQTIENEQDQMAQDRWERYTIYATTSPGE